MNAASTVRVWIIPVGAPPAAMARYREVLDDGERARVAELASPRDQQRFTVAHGALRMLAGRELKTPPAALRWTSGRHGKPELASEWSWLHTSLSHEDRMVAVAISTARAVGVDIQHLVPGLDPVRMSARFFSPGEAEHVAAGPGASARADRFARLWVRKEAVVKAAGGRLGPNLAIAVHDRDVVSCAEPPSVHRVADVPAPAGFRVAVALAGAEVFVLSPTGGNHPPFGIKGSSPERAVVPPQTV